MIWWFSSMTFTGMMRCDVASGIAWQSAARQGDQGTYGGRIVRRGERMLAEIWPKLEWEGITDGRHIRTCSILGEVEEAQ
jgi:hypothetical protein